MNTVKHLPEVRPPRLAVVGHTMINIVCPDYVFPGKGTLPDMKLTQGGFPIVGTKQGANLGFEVHVYSAAGRDHHGDAIEAALRDAGAETTGFQRVSLPTPFAVVLVKDGQRGVNKPPSIMQMARWKLTDSVRELITLDDYIAPGGTLDPDEPRDSNLRDITNLGRMLHKPLFLNPTQIHDVGSLDLNGVQLVQLSREDLSKCGFTRESPLQVVADRLLGRGAESVVITDGARGEWGFRRGQTEFMPALPDCQARYPIGCGDAAFIGHVSGQIRFGPTAMRKWLAVGALAGGFFVEHGRAARWAEILEMLKSWPPDMVL